MSSNPKIDVSRFIKQEGNTCGAHSIYNYLVLIGKIDSKQDPADQKAAIATIYQQITSSQTGEAALPNLMLAFLNKNGAAVALYASGERQSKLDEICRLLRIAAKITYFEDPFSTALAEGQYGIALWNTTEEFPSLDQLATMHYTVVYKNARGDIYALDSNCPAEGWQSVDSQFNLHFMGLLFA